MTERAIPTGIVYFGTFLVLGWWMNRKGVGLGEVYDLAGPDCGPRDAFLLGVWRKER